MAEVLSWTLAVFALLAGPPLVVLLVERGRARSHHRERPRPLEEDRRRPPHEDGGLGPSTPRGAWPVMLLVASSL